jgi:hypothetical protein
MLSEPAASLTDLALGVVTLTLAFRLHGRDVQSYWRRTFWWAAAAALAGAVHHGFVTYSDTWSGPSWAVISGMVVLTVSFVLAASVQDVLGAGRRRVFWALRSASLVAYAGLAALGYYGIATILACEGVTMVAILVLWEIARRRGHPRARAMAWALGASVLAGCTRALPADVADLVRLDPTSLYHLAQIPGMVLLYIALVPAARSKAQAAVRLTVNRPGFEDRSRAIG